MSAPAPRPKWIPQALLIALSLGTSLLILGALEGILRAAGVGAPDPSRASRLKYQQIVLPALVEDTLQDGTAIWRPADMRLPWQVLQKNKPEGSLRILAFGGSATAGLGYGPNVTFARYLERMLHAHSPDRRIEVANLGIVALSSRQVKLLVADACARYAPDLVILYSGNNEFLEVHAEKYALAKAGMAGRVADTLRRTHLFRALDHAVRGAPEAPSLAEQDFSNDDLRITQQSIVREIEMSPGEVAEIIDAYATNVGEMIESAGDCGSDVLLLSVASNWEWRGREDLPQDWLGELLGEPGAAGTEALRRARGLLDARLASAPEGERSALLFQRARAAEALLDFAAARRDYRAAMNEDPHLRRALDAMNERAREAAGRGARTVDTVTLLAEEARHGIVGFREFYDYVHFTPSGALRVAAGLLAELEALGLIETRPDSPAKRFLARELEALETLSGDPLELDRWLGIGDDASRVHDRDLWKYERMLGALDERIDADPGDFRARVHRANAHYFDVRGGVDAERLYRAALPLAPDAASRAAVEANLARLLAEGRS